MVQQLIILSLCLSMFTIFADAFFLNWGSAADQPNPTYKGQQQYSSHQMHQLQSLQSPYYEYYQQRFLQPQASSIHAQYVPAPQPQQEQPVLQQQQSSSQNGYVQQQRPMQGSQIPAVPIQLPLQAQLSPVPSIQNVQLVPCLCPISQEEIDKASEIYSLKPKN